MAQTTKTLREKAEDQLLKVGIPGNAAVVKSATVEELEAELSEEDEE